MKNLVIVLSFLCSINTFSQKSAEYTKFVEDLKKDSETDKNDKVVYHLLNDFYEQALQSDEGELKPEIAKKIQNFFANKNSKNKQILHMFFAYQNHISETAAVGKQPDPNFQVNLMNDLEAEVLKVYGNIPVIISIYKAEALSSNGQTKEAGDLIAASLHKFPHSIPLKVYKYLDSKDSKIKEDLTKNHSSHWMVQQFGIK